MAYTVNQATTGVQGAADQLIYVVQDTTNTGQPKFRYVCRVQLDTATIIKLKQLPNNSSCAVFDVQRVLQAYVYQDTSVYDLGLLGVDGTFDTTKIFGRNGAALRTFTMRFGYEYAPSATTQPQESLLPATDTDVTVVNGSFLTPSGSYPLSSAAANDYKMTSNSKFFLSDAAVTMQDTGNVDDVVLYPVAYDRQPSKATLAFLNGNDVGASQTVLFKVQYFQGPNGGYSAVLQNTASAGGAAPAAGLSDAESLLYLGIGPFNLESQSIDASLKPSANGDWTHYDVVAMSSAVPGNEKSATYRFVRQECSKHYTAENAYTIHWWNSKGGVDSLPLMARSTESQTIEKEAIRTSGGNSLTADGFAVPYEKTSAQGGKRAGRVRTTTTLQMNTVGGNPSVYTPFIKSLVNSSKAFISGPGMYGLNSGQPGSGLVQCYVTEAQKEYLTSVNDQSVSYALTVEISRRRPNV